MKTEELEHAYLIGAEGEEATAYLKAVIGVSKDLRRVVYSYDKLIQAYMDYNGWTEDEAIEWHEYNTERGLLYLSESSRPIVTHTARINKNNSQFMPMALDN